MTIRSIPCNALKPGFDMYRDEYVAAAVRVLQSGWYVLGHEVEVFEREFASYLGARWCVGLNSGLDALLLAVRALEIGKGDEVIVPANTYIATVLGITKNGATPVFVEPDEYHNIDPDKIEAAITPHTKAILVVHLYGQPCRMNKIMDTADKYHLPVVEDCAQSHGASFGEKMTGTFGAISCFSFYPTKNLGGFGDGGAVVTDDEALAAKVRLYRNYGSEKKYYNKVQGVNSRLDEIQAALLRVRLSHLRELTAARKKIATVYNDGITHPLIRLPQIAQGAEHVWHQYVVTCPKRDELRAYLKGRGIDTLIHYPIPPHLSEAYRSLGYGKGSFPLAEKDADSVVSLPFFSGMSMSDAEYVVDALNAWRE